MYDSRFTSKNMIISDDGFHTYMVCEGTVMLFNSYIFVLFFLPICILGYFGLNRLGKYKTAQIFLLGMSLWFYGYAVPKYLFIIIASIIINYVFYLISNRLSRSESIYMRKFILLTALFVNIGILVYFKYTDFFIRTANDLLRKNWSALNIALPLGISFFTFQQISFIIDTYRGEVPEYSFLNYASFVAFFPQLIAGPIVSHDELVPQFMDKEKKRVNWDYMATGIVLFTYGLAKKVLLADTFGNAANIGFGNIGELDTTNAVISMLAYTLQIYFDFSGYCDMAVGIGRMLNIDLPLNFNSPYKALDINEFWDRWHMTLTRFFTKYVYIPLGGSRKGTVRTYFNIFIVFLLSGFWHGAGWHFIFWGVTHGIFCIITRHFKTIYDKIPAVLRWCVTFGFVNVAWVLFRAPTLRSGLSFVKRILLFDFGALDTKILKCFQMPELAVLSNGLPAGGENIILYFSMAAIFILAFILILGTRNAYERLQDYKPTIVSLCTTTLLLVWCIFSFAGVSIFLYFNF